MSKVKNVIDELVAEFPFLTIDTISNEMIENAFYCEIDGHWSTIEQGSIWCACD